MNKNILSGAFFSIVFSLFTVANAQATVIFDENSNGDLSGDLNNPTVLNLNLGTNTIIGQIGDNGDTGATNGQDADYFTFTLPSDLLVTSITIDNYESVGASPQTQSFLGFTESNFFTGQGNADIDGFVLFSNTSGEILDDITGGLTPLGAGDFAFWLQETGANSLINYSISFEVAAVPVPAALPLFLSAITGLFAFRRNK